VSVNKRLVSYHISRLGDKDPVVRLKAIKELELLNDVDALADLERLYTSDDNVDVRKAAQLAGRNIFLSNQAKES
jgi:HEAT repeat protein